MAREGLKVEVPKPEGDRPELGRVGVIAGVGFAIGVAWPWLAGVRLVPSPPTDELEPAAASSAAPSASAGAPALAGSAAAAEPPDDAPPERTKEETVKISESKITVCRDGGKKHKECDKIGIDAAFRTALTGLAKCEPASGANDTLSLGLELDFEKKAVTDVFAGKSTTFSKDKARALVDCQRGELSAVKLDGIDHEHGRYTVYYFVEFIPPGTTVQAAAPGAEETASASGLATIGWDVAVVRDAPEDGKILTRLRYGTRVVVSARRGKWYEVKYDAKGDKGWVHRNALGL
ncbi:MAG TPA: SH3 domain-containing protein [Polyangiaceae bacterium]|nr:SH3 domain-containing protein [Polyangiaceae bacterium]